ncbi:hypothetical protein [Hymenobacter volaticus]|uniref:Uncharacterized protein n=1 Tax=Hymenobacter volaticus TaxID=2932254 RepID=A0ABY4GDY0_9BACT|nr:hypothetical protein [Hymenobacter volaticus]UOQ68990.1 hypothetical protein MUN86_26150 [Hymenobacter volaticus]
MRRERSREQGTTLASMHELQARELKPSPLFRTTKNPAAASGNPFKEGWRQPAELALKQLEQAVYAPT